MTRPDMVVPAAAGATPPFSGYDLTPGGCIVLYPTKTRQRLLRDVQAGRCFRDAIGADYISGGPRISARIAEMQLAGWVELESAEGNQLAVWRLTDAGRAAIEAAHNA